MIRSLIARRAVAVLVAGATATLGLAASAGATGIIVKPNSNLAVGGGSYAGTVSAPKSTFPKVPDPAATPSARTVTTKVGAAGIIGAAGTFTAADIGAFVDDGPGGRLPDGVDVTAMTPLVPVYPSQGLAYIKGVNPTGTTATLSQKAVAAGSGAVSLIAATPAVLLLAQSTGALAYLAPVPTGLCWVFAFPGNVCGYDIGNIAYGATKQVVTANADGSLGATSFTLSEGVIDGTLGTQPGPLMVRSFDPDGAGAYPVLPFAVAPDDPGATARRCAPNAEDRSIPDTVGGVDYCMVTAIALNGGVQATKIPFSITSFPITWAASAAGSVSGSTLAIIGSNFANNDVIVKIVVANGKAKVTGNPLVKCPGLNQTILGTTATATGDVLAAASTAGCTVPSGSLTKVTLIGTKDIQRSEIPPNAVIGINAPKKATAIITMP